MKFKLILTVLAAFALAGQTLAGQSGKGRKVLVAYFSWSGNTRELAGQIAEAAGADIYEIVPAKAYPSDYNTCVAQAKREKQEAARPALKGKLPATKNYDIVFVGFPNWWGTMPMPVATFLDKIDLKGKTVIPFVTHGGGGRQQCIADFRKAAAEADVIEGPVMEGTAVKGAKAKVEAWVREKLR